MTTWSDGVTMSASAMNDCTPSFNSTDTTLFTASANWTLTSTQVISNKGWCTLIVNASRTTSAITEAATNTGNIADTAIAVISATFLSNPNLTVPPVDMNGIYGTGAVDGEFTLVAATGTFTLRSISGNAGIQIGDQVRMNVTYPTFLPQF